MNELLSVISELTERIPPDTLMYLAEEINKIDCIDELYTIPFNPSLKTLKSRFLDACEKSGCSTTVIASTLRGACTIADVLNRRVSIDLVWTGPQTEYINIRHTESVLVELIDAAHEQIFMVSFVAYQASSIMKALRDAIARGVRVHMLLELSKEQGGRQVDHDSLGFMKNKLPEVQLYYWKQENSKGVVHAKCAIEDGERLFITSANISVSAMEKNMEAGVLVHGGDVPEQMMRHLQALIDTEVIVPFET